MNETTIPTRFLDAPRAKSHGGFLHTCNGDVVSGLPFGRKDTETCARCWDMVTNSAPARADHAAGRRNLDAERSAEMRAHFASERHRSGGCGIVCTKFDW